MNKKYINVSVELPEELTDLGIALISDLPFTGIEEKNDEIIISFQDEKWNDKLKGELLLKLQTLWKDIRISKEEELNEKNWNEEWESNLPPVIITDNIGIAPEWKINELDQKIKLVINPKMSFGTGHHATTRLMCRLMERVVKPGSVWIDAGTGSGVLAILAVKLGAASVFAFDNNSWAIENAVENFELNHSTEQISITETELSDVALPVADGIAANLYTHLLLPSFGKFYECLSKTNGDLIVSGVLKYDEQEVIKSAQGAGFRLIEIVSEDEWIGVHFKLDSVKKNAKPKNSRH